MLLILALSLGKHKSIVHGIAIVTPYTTVWRIVIVVCILSFLMLLLNYVPEPAQLKFEFLFLINIVVFASLIVISINDFIGLYLSLELQGLCLYILVTFKHQSAFSTEGGIKYFILGSLASSFILFGMSLIYGFTGSLNLQLIEACLVNTDTHTLSICTIGLSFLVSGLLFKLTAVPFHT